MPKKPVCRNGVNTNGWEDPLKWIKTHSEDARREILDINISVTDQCESRGYWQTLATIILRGDDKNVAQKYEHFLIKAPSETSAKHYALAEIYHYFSGRNWCNFDRDFGPIFNFWVKAAGIYHKLLQKSHGWDFHRAQVRIGQFLAHNHIAIDEKFDSMVEDWKNCRVKFSFNGKAFIGVQAGHCKDEARAFCNLDLIGQLCDSAFVEPFIDDIARTASGAASVGDTIDMVSDDDDDFETLTDGASQNVENKMETQLKVINSDNKRIKTKILP